jgi:hypothetical protein
VENAAGLRTPPILMGLCRRRKITRKKDALMTERLSEKVMIEYLKVADWADRQAALRSPVGDTMHGLSAEAIRVLVAEVRELRAELEQRVSLFGDMPESEKEGK